MRRTSQNEDFSILREVEQGKSEAFKELYEKYWDSTFSQAYKRLKNTDQAKDIVQDIFANIWLRRDSLHIENFPAYLNIAVRNQVLKIIHKQKNDHPFFDLLENLPELYNNADANILCKELAVSYEKLVESLPSQRKLIFKLRFQEELNTKQIAESLHLSKKTVQNQLARAVEQLKISLSHILFLIIILLPSLFS